MVALSAVLAVFVVGFQGVLMRTRVATFAALLGLLVSASFLFCRSTVGQTCDNGDLEFVNEDCCGVLEGYNVCHGTIGPLCEETGTLKHCVGNCYVGNALPCLTKPASAAVDPQPGPIPTCNAAFEKWVQGIKVKRAG